MLFGFRDRGQIFRRNPGFLSCCVFEDDLKIPKILIELVTYTFCVRKWRITYVSLYALRMITKYYNITKLYK